MQTSSVCRITQSRADPSITIVTCSQSAVKATWHPVGDKKKMVMV